MHLSATSLQCQITKLSLFTKKQGKISVRLHSLLHLLSQNFSPIWLNTESTDKSITESSSLTQTENSTLQETCLTKWECLFHTKQQLLQQLSVLLNLHNKKYLTQLKSLLSPILLMTTCTLQQVTILSLLKI